MSNPNSVTVRVPATTANIGPGFDCMGAALTLYNTLEFTDSQTDALSITVIGQDAHRVPTNANNLAYQAFVKLYEAIAQSIPPIHMTITMGVPLARGLGSSATAIVGGLLGANVWAGSPLSKLDLMNLAIAIEGHPDNVVPALLGGCQLTTTEANNQWLVCDVPWHSDIVPVIAIPEFELSTTEARRVLPQHYSRADAIFNTAHLGCLVRALGTGNGDWLKAALQDRIHQPYRKTLITGFDRIRIAAIDAGAYEMVISGAGPTLLALASPPQAQAVGQAMVNAWEKEGIRATAEIQKIDQEGAIAIKN